MLMPVDAQHACSGKVRYVIAQLTGISLLLRVFDI